MFLIFAILFRNAMKRTSFFITFLLLSTLSYAQNNDMSAASRYKTALFPVVETTGIQYGQAMGYWTEMDDKTPMVSKLLQMKQTSEEQTLNLYLDLYEPQGDTAAKRPLVMLIHGGSFYFGTRNDTAISKWSQHLASLGYVAASIDYRLGFFPTAADIERAGYRALQDAHAALRFLVAHQETFRIDTSMIFVGGCSAGAITALNLAFMTDETRPSASYESIINSDLGDIESSGNNIKDHFSIKCVVDMWGAVHDTSIMRGHHIPIIAFHGNADDIVPYGYTHPFEMAGDISKLITNKIYGSSCIIDYAQKHGIKAKLYTFEGFGHSPHRDPQTKTLNENFYFIQNKMTEFFYQIIKENNPTN